MSTSLRVRRVHLAVAIDTAVWRGLSLARSLNGRSPWLARQLRRAVLVVWWTLTLQLGTHFGYWVRARRLRREAPKVVSLAAVVEPHPAHVVVPLSEHPLVSLIIPTFGQLAFTLRCLASVARHAGDVPIEVIVVDDAWNGEDAGALANVQGIRLIRNEANLGFLLACNKAAEQARGQYLLFLNNDTEVMADWLPPMLALFEQRPDTGAVGAKLLYPGGRLQEAGGIIWQDASGWNFGRLEDQGGPEYNYVREVDYCSGAALMVRRPVFADLGGFDERYAPAYYEDTDLCFRLRRMGLRVLYQPAARVVHHEGISHGRDTSVGLKSLQMVNQRRFAAVWADELARSHYPNGTHVFRARERAKAAKIVLAIDHYVPMPDRDAGSRAIVTALDVLSQNGWVVKFWPHNLSYSPGYTENLQAMGIEVFHGPGHTMFDDWIRRTGDELDMVLVSRPDVAEDVIVPIRRHSRARLVYYGHDLHFRRMRLQAEVTQDERLLRMAARMRQRERAIWRQAGLSLYLSEEEARIASALQPDARIGSVLPYCFDRFGAERPAPATAEVIFVAGFGHPPNEDAAVWFVSQVLPLVTAQAPAARVSVIGSAPTKRVLALAGDRVSVFANVSAADLEAAYARARVAVVPLRCGAGVKLKVVEALREGVPLVTTPVGAQGLPGLSRFVAVEDDAERFAAAVVALLRDDGLWVERCSRQLAFARETFSREAMRESWRVALG